MNALATTTFTPQEQTLLEQMGYANLPERHVRAFLYTAATMGLDPLLGEISLIERNAQGGGKTYTVQVGIAGYRKAARRIATEQGIKLSESEPEYCGEDGVWKPMWLQKWGAHPEAVRVTVTRDGEAFPVVISWDEFAQFKRDGSPMALWATKPSYMLAKTATSLAYRRAFPVFNGTYETDERIDGVPEAPTVQQVAATTTIPEIEAQVVEGNSPQEIIAAAQAATTIEDVRALWTLAGGDLDVQAALTARAEQLSGGAQ